MKISGKFKILMMYKGQNIGKVTTKKKNLFQIHILTSGSCLVYLTDINHYYSKIAFATGEASHVFLASASLC